MKKFILGMSMMVLLMGCGNSQESQAPVETEKDKNDDVKVETELTTEEEKETEEATKDGEGEINISAAASLQDALEEITADYEKENGVKFNLNFGGSGALQTQIEEGAKADIFISAAQKQMKALVEGELIEEDKVSDLLINDVVLIVQKDSENKVTKIEDLANEEVALVALGEPESVPVGQYSQEILDYYEIADLVNGKATYGSDVRQVLNWVASGEVDAGFVYRTDAMIEEGVEIIEAAPEGSHKPVIYPAAILKDAENEELASDFLEYLKSDKALEIFENYGFGKAN